MGNVRVYLIRIHIKYKVLKEILYKKYVPQKETQFGQEQLYQIFSQKYDNINILMCFRYKLQLKEKSYPLLMNYNGNGPNSQKP